MYSEFRVAVLKCPTLAYLAFRIFITKFLNEDFKIPIIIGNMYHDFKKGYTVGYVDVIKPYGKNIYRYDVNSLYPYAMKNDMPVGNPVFFFLFLFLFSM